MSTSNDNHMRSFSGTDLLMGSEVGLAERGVERGVASLEESLEAEEGVQSTSIIEDSCEGMELKDNLAIIITPHLLPASDSSATPSKWEDTPSATPSKWEETPSATPSKWEETSATPSKWEETPATPSKWEETSATPNKWTEVYRKYKVMGNRKWEEPVQEIRGEGNRKWEEPVVDANSVHQKALLFGGAKKIRERL